VVLWPSVAVGVLVLSIVPFRAALTAARKGARVHALVLLALATLVQAAVFGVQLHLFEADLASLTPQASAYASIYFVLLGAALAHLAIGLTFDLWLLVRIAGRLTAYRLTGLEAACLYWYVVSGLSVLVVVTQISPRL
jgi:heme/copper-type cytochrome/quinol oxidase subunit 3